VQIKLFAFAAFVVAAAALAFPMLWQKSLPRVNAKFTNIYTHTLTNTYTHKIEKSMRAGQKMLPESRQKIKMPKQRVQIKWQTAANRRTGGRKALIF